MGQTAVATTWLGIGSGASSDKLRVLCLSGHASKWSVTEVQASHLQLEEAHGCELHYLDGPFEVGMPYDASLQAILSPPFYTWMIPGARKLERSRKRLRYGVDHLLEHVANQGPFDGVFGFSLGALVCTLAAQELQGRQFSARPQEEEARPRVLQCIWNTREPQPWFFNLLACSPHLEGEAEQERDGSDSGAFPQTLPQPSFHIIGDLDPIADQSQHLAETYANPIVHHLPYAAHAVPAEASEDEELQRSLRCFFDRMREFKGRRDEVPHGG